MHQFLDPKLQPQHEDPQDAPRAAQHALFPRAHRSSAALKVMLTGQGSELSCHLQHLFSREKSNRHVYEQKTPLATATAFSEPCDKYVVLVHVSFIAGITQAHTKQ